MMDFFFYVVIVIIILKVIFWVFYFYSRYKRKEIQRLITRVRDADLNSYRYEEEPAVPRPAFMFSSEGRERAPYPVTLPAYTEEDPDKIVNPPPPYIPTAEEVHPVVCTEQSYETYDTQQLINSNEEET